MGLGLGSRIDNYQRRIAGNTTVHGQRRVLRCGATCLLQLRFVRSSRVTRKASLASSEGKPHDIPPMALAAYLASAEHCCVCRKRSEPTWLG